jgi:hypothetical protein
MGFRTPLALLVALLGVAASCNRVHYDVVSGPRDWTAHPGFVEIPPPRVLYAISDIHGGYDRMAALLAGNHIIAPEFDDPKAVRWTAGDAVLLVVGDLIDKGPKSLAVIESLMALEASAAAGGGRLVVTLGNHEGFFFVDPFSHRADSRYGSFDDELEDDGLTPINIASGLDPRGKWLRDRPFGAHVGNWFFSHAGNTQGRTMAELEAMVHTAVDEHNFDDDNLLGDSGLLESKEWYVDHDDLPPAYAAAVGARHMVFGHDPTDSLSEPGTMGLGQDGNVIRIDCGMSPRVDYSHGRIFRVTRSDTEEVAESVDEFGTAVGLWRGLP